MQVESAVIWDRDFGVNLGFTGTRALGSSLGIVHQRQVHRRRRRVKANLRHHRSSKILVVVTDSVLASPVSVTIPPVIEHC